MFAHHLIKFHRIYSRNISQICSTNTQTFLLTHFLRYFSISFNNITYIYESTAQAFNRESRVRQIIYVFIMDKHLQFFFCLCNQLKNSHLICTMPEVKFEESIYIKFCDCLSCSIQLFFKIYFILWGYKEKKLQQEM